MLRILFLGIILISTLSVNAQKNINEYKYVIVPKSYSFLKGEDKYQLNSLTKFLLTKYGFEAFIQRENFPEDLKANGCKALRADLKRKQGLFLTKLTLELIDCNGSVVFTSVEGKSREKEFKAAYHEALRNSFKSIGALNYKYSGDKEEKIVKRDIVSESSSKRKNPNSTKEVKEKTIEVIPPSENSITYLFNDVNYVFVKQEYGYEMFGSEEKQNSIGKIFKSGSGKNYIVQAGDLSGNGYFDGYGNFILERINPVTNKLITDTFARQ
ncbi:hypothetical protein ATE84_4790 [Aquimarina sp. MAR_2010_214]|uniref:hypothetical protein n=1 Tax=Aquimarina sp. MAR_2010_214 TaxID=1250026 RepID=UPI000C706D13|nr:hypothetical protein [Aquimarina sp. MAR_2010_214]PKV52670.1 hypothetical protein ATE84_4790 [Aquimarina sp. MAR_2010_214]